MYYLDEIRLQRVNAGSLFYDAFSVTVERR
jgi:hypothetical protein